jgi:glycerophosphoryl diester phosphodiesterase
MLTRNAGAWGLAAVLGAAPIGCAANVEDGGRCRAPISEATQGRSVCRALRPFSRVLGMDDEPLEAESNRCSVGPFRKSDFSIGHRGAALGFPEHTKESYEAAARMGAGIIECDVTFTKDKQLVCRHSQCDLHTTTNILAIPTLAAKCTQPFAPADPLAGRPASARCCTSDITLAEFRTLCGKMDVFNPQATTVTDYLDETASVRGRPHTTCGTVVSHQESIELISRLGAKSTPELKAPSVIMPYEGTYTEEMYAQQMIDEYKVARVPASHVFAQSFDLDDVLYWLRHEPRFGAQAVYLDDRVDGGDDAELVARMADIAAKGVKIIAPPIRALIARDSNGKMVPSPYARAAKSAGLDIIAWTLERAGTPVTAGGDGWPSVVNPFDSVGDTFALLDVLAQQVEVRGVFSDWPATVTRYANCNGL